jgi:hypothetical protein
VLLECGNCHYKGTGGSFLSGGLAGGGYGASDGATQVPSQPFAKFNVDTGQIRVAWESKTYPLRLGSNVIGRIAQSGTADLQISNDEYMSRRHVQIDVVKKNGIIEHHLVEINSKNIVYLNGKPIERGDVLILNFGDKLTLGKTTVYLEKTAVSNSEETRAL